MQGQWSQHGDALSQGKWWQGLGERPLLTPLLQSKEGWGTEMPNKSLSSTTLLQQALGERPRRCRGGHRVWELVADPCLVPAHLRGISAPSWPQLEGTGGPVMLTPRASSRSWYLWAKVKPGLES